MVKYKYDLFGNLINISGSEASTIGKYNHFRFKGYYFDEESNMYYCKSRYYVPEWGRYLLPMDISEFNIKLLVNLNLYSIASNNLVTKTSNISVVNNKRVKTGDLKFKLPKTNSVLMTHYTEKLIDNIYFSMFFGNISYTRTKQHQSNKNIYTYTNLGNGGNSYGVGISIGDYFGANLYVSDNVGFGAGIQVGNMAIGAGISIKDGLSLSIGVVNDDTTDEIGINIGWGSIIGAGYAFCVGISLSPMIGGRILGGLVACVILLFDIFNE